MQVKDAIELNQINKDLIYRKDWTAEEHVAIYKNFMQKLCKKIQKHEDYYKEGMINIVMTYSEFPFIINGELYYDFLKYFELTLNHIINRHGSRTTTFKSGFLKKKTYIIYVRNIGFRVTPLLRKKINKLLTIRFIS